MLETTEVILAVVQCTLLAPLAILGLHRGWMLLLDVRSRFGSRAANPPTRVVPAHESDWPRVCVQLPIYNERDVAVRLIECIAQFDYPHDRFEIQVLDDSTDDTADRIAATLDRLPDSLQISHVRRADRRGFKAGALANGLAHTDAEFVAVFDADFLPPADFLRRTVPVLLGDARLGMAQARWGHLNPDYSVLTDMQRTLLDGHFLVEHVARARSGCFFNFNGTAGLFRRACIEDAGGWQHDTLTEDMDLSYRAQLRDWKFAYLPELECRAELPIEMNAFLGQQHRWAKGSIQVGRKLLGRVMRAPVPLVVKVEALFHLAGNVAFPLLLGLVLIALPLQIVRTMQGGPVAPWLSTFEATPLLLATACLLAYYIVARFRAGTLRLSTILRLPLVIAVGAGLCINNTAAVWSAFDREPGTFNRTPKRDVVDRSRPLLPASYRSRRGRRPLLELGLALWAATTAVLAFTLDLPGTGVFHGLFALGLAWTGGASIREDLARHDPVITRRVAVPANS